MEHQIGGARSTTGVDHKAVRMTIDPAEVTTVVIDKTLHALIISLRERSVMRTLKPVTLPYRLPFAADGIDEKHLPRRAARHLDQPELAPR